MKIYYRESKEIRDNVLDFTESHFSTDEIIKQIAQRLRDNQLIHSLTLENIECYEKGINALRHAILGHKSLRKLHLKNVTFSSYPTCTADEYFFPPDLDKSVEHLCAMLRDGRLNEIKLTDFHFRDYTIRRYEHFDMVEPAVMRDLLLEEKQPSYVQEIFTSLKHNPHLVKLELSIVEWDTQNMVREIEAIIQKRQLALCVNAVLEGTHAATETHLFPEFFKMFAAWVWFNNLMKKKR